MKYTLVVVFFLLSTSLFSQTKRALRQQVIDLEGRVDDLKSDTSFILKEKNALKDSLMYLHYLLKTEKSKTSYLELAKEREASALNAEIDRLNKLFARLYQESNVSNSSRKYKRVYFGEKDEFHGYTYQRGGASVSPDYIAIPDGVRRKLLNEIDLSNFSIDQQQRVFFLVHVSTNGSIVKLWCNEQKSRIKNVELLTLIGEEIIAQAKYEKFDVPKELVHKGFGGGHPGHLVELDLQIPRIKNK